MLSKLKAIIAKANKTAVILAVMLVLSGISLNSYIYDDTIQVHINVDGVTVKTVNTKAGTVGDILANENISLEQGGRGLSLRRTRSFLLQARYR